MSERKLELNVKLTVATGLDVLMHIAISPTWRLLELSLAIIVWATSVGGV